MSLSHNEVQSIWSTAEKPKTSDETTANNSNLAAAVSVVAAKSKSILRSLGLRYNNSYSLAETLKDDRR